jgi:hypothetical protein
MAKTYTPIANVTLTGYSGANGNYFEFTNIPQDYTDLVLSINAGLNLADSYDLLLRLNNDSTSLYSHTWLQGSGSSVASTRLSNRDAVYLDYNGGSSIGVNRHYLVNIMNYSNTTTYKSFLNKASYDYGVELHANLYRSTSAIASIQVVTNAYGMIAGSTATLYGIKAA